MVDKHNNEQHHLPKSQIDRLIFDFFILLHFISLFVTAMNELHKASKVTWSLGNADTNTQLATTSSVQS